MRSSRRMTVGWLAAVLAATVLVCGCQGTIQSGGKLGKIEPPPNIPEPPPLAVQDNNPNDPKRRLVYSDIIAIEEELLANHDEPETEKERNAHDRNLSLVHAVQEAIKRGVLTPLPFNPKQPGYFDPQTPITYGQLYQWATDFEKPAGFRVLPKYGDVLEAPNGESDPDESESIEAAMASAEQATAQSGLTLPMTVEGVTLDHGTIVSREILCLIYTVLSNQEDRANRLSPDDIQKANPQGNSVYALGEAPDAANISEWAQKYVAVAYQDNLLKNVLYLSPSAMIRGSGLNPKRAVTRGEAITFLYQFYASRSGNTQASSQRQGTNNP